MVRDPGSICVDPRASLAPTDPDVPERACPPRRYSAKYKARILAEYDTLAKADKGALLRREGLYSSLITLWRKQRDRGALVVLAVPLAGDRRTPETARFTRLRPRSIAMPGELDKAPKVIEVEGQLGAVGAVRHRRRRRTRGARRDDRPGRGRAGRRRARRLSGPRRAPGPLASPPPQVAGHRFRPSSWTPSSTWPPSRRCTGCSGPTTRYASGGAMPSTGRGEARTRGHHTEPGLELGHHEAAGAG